MSTICALLQDYGFCHVQHLRRLTTVNAQVLCLSEHFLIDYCERLRVRVLLVMMTLSDNDYDNDESCYMYCKSYFNMIKSKTKIETKNSAELKLN